MTERFRISGARDVRASLDGNSEESIVVACPPHPQMGGDRRDARLRAVSDTLQKQGVACLRIDYGPWDEGEGEQTDVRNALAWAREEYPLVGLFGYSFGGTMALLAAAGQFREGGDGPVAVSVLSPDAIIEGLNAADAVDAIDCPLQVVYGERDDTVDSVPVAERAREHDAVVEALPADHFFVGQHDRVGELAGAFLADRLRGYTDRRNC
jgi:alpha/beta superfamily hydrolase